MIGIVWGDTLEGFAARKNCTGTTVRLDWFWRVGLRVAIGFGLSLVDRRQLLALYRPNEQEAVYPKDDPVSG